MEARSVTMEEDVKSDSEDSSCASAPREFALATAQLVGADSTTEVVRALSVLCKVSSESASSSPGDLLQTGAIGAVAHAMRTQHESVVQHLSLAALRSFSVAPELRSEVIREGALGYTLELMAADSSLIVQDRGSTIIANLAVGCPHRKRRLARDGAMTSVVRAMRMYPHDIQIQVRGSLALRNLAHNAQVNQYLAGKAGAVDAVLDALIELARGSEKELLYQTVAALESMCSQDKNNRLRVIQRDMISWPLEFQSDSGADIDPGSQGHCSGTLAYVDRLEAGEDEDVSKSVSVDGFLSPGDDGQDDPSHSSVREPHINEFRDVTSCRSSGSGVSSGKKADASGSTSVFRIILRAVRKTPENRALIKFVLSLLTLTSWKQHKVQKRLGELGAVEVALATVKRYEDDVPLVTRSCALLSTLCLQAENRERVHSGLGVLFRSLEKHHRNSSVLREVISALSNALYCSPRNRESALVRGGMGAVSKVLMLADGQDLRALEASLCTLRNLVDGREDSALECAREKGVSGALAALDVSKNAANDVEKRVQAQAILLLGDIAKSAPVTVIEMRASEAADWVENGLAKLDKSKFVQVHLVGDTLISSLQRKSSSDDDIAAFTRLSNGCVDDSHSFSFSNRWAHTKEMFLSLSTPFSANKRSTEPPGRRISSHGRSWGRGERTDSRLVQSRAFARLRRLRFTNR